MEIINSVVVVYFSPFLFGIVGMCILVYCHTYSVAAAGCFPAVVGLSICRVHRKVWHTAFSPVPNCAVLVILAESFRCTLIAEGSEQHFRTYVIQLRSSYTTVVLFNISTQVKGGVVHATRSFFRAHPRLWRAYVDVLLTIPRRG